MRALLLCLALAACGQAASPPAPDAEVATTSGFDLSGHIIAVGSDFRLDAIPDQNTTVLVFPDYDQTVSGPYVAPQATDTGAMFQTGDMMVTLTPGACVHNGATYPMNAHIEVTNARPADGCAIVRWDRHLQELIPQIDACIAQSPQTTWVSYAGRSGGDEVTVLLGGNNQFVECKVTGGVATVTPRVDGATPIAGDSEALFVRGSSGPNPGGECYEAPEVRSASGELLGWMMDPLGC